MSPPETTTRKASSNTRPRPSPTTARGISQFICEEKHMGSRAIAMVGRDPDAIERTFRIASDVGGIVYTRTGRRFFADEAIELEVLMRLRHAITRAGLWEELKTDWFLLDLEMMPWSVKAGELLLTQYAAVGSAAEQSFAVAIQLRVDARPGSMSEICSSAPDPRRSHRGISSAYRHYCWEVNSVDDLRIAPFHVLASEGAVHIDKDHVWHMRTLARMTSGEDTLVVATANRPWTSPIRERGRSGQWWETLTSAGGEGMVIKPTDFLVWGKRGMVQPAMKCRGPEYLRIIYGPEYWLVQHLERLRERGLSQSAAWPCASSPSALSRSNVSSGASHCGASMNACSAYSRWKVSPWILACDGFAAARGARPGRSNAPCYRDGGADRRCVWTAPLRGVLCHADADTRYQ